MKDQEFVEYIVKALVDNPDNVKVERRVDEMGVLITLDVDPMDMGKVIGRDGATAKALRTLLRVVGMKNSARINLKINEPNGGNGGHGGHVRNNDVDMNNGVSSGDVSTERFSRGAYSLNDVDGVLNDLKGI